MTTNNINPSFLDPSVLAKLAGEYFPEFSLGEAEEAAATPQELIPPVQENVTLTQPSAPSVQENVQYAQPVTPFVQENLPYAQTVPSFPSVHEVVPAAHSYGNVLTEVDFLRAIPSSFDFDSYGTSYLPGSYAPSVVSEPVPFSGPFDVNIVRRDFPILSEKVNGGKNLVWLDNAATTHKPRQVIDRIKYYYEHENSNVHRGAHELAARSTDAYEDAREKVARFLNAPSAKEIVYVRGATEAINLVASAYAKHHLQKDDEILITWLEHHANIVPWQLVCAETGAKLRVAPVDENGQILLDEFQKLLSSRTKIVALAHVSNALGTITPVAEMVSLAHRYGAKVLVDGAQAVSHLKVDVQALDCDFYVFSGHKVFGPTGIGALYGKPEVLEAMHPYQGGGNMIVDVTFEKTIIHPAPARFEAGTGNIADAVGLGAALDYVQAIGLDIINRYEHFLLEYGIEALSRVPGLRLIGTAKEKASVLSFVLADYTTEEVGNALSKEGIAVRSGHHCAQPILRRFGLESTVRPSLAFYNTCEEIDALVSVLLKLKK